MPHAWHMRKRRVLSPRAARLAAGEVGEEEVANQLSLGLAYIICQKLLPRADDAGRVVAMEVLNNTNAVQNLIRAGKLEQLYSTLQTKTRDVATERMVTMEQSLAGLAA